MTDQPLQPFAPPVGFENYVPHGFSSGLAMQWFLYAVFACWAIYTAVAIYHWLKYSHASWLAMPAIALHLFVSFVLAVYTLSGAVII